MSREFTKMEPKPSINGSGAEELINQRREAMDAIRAAEAALRKMSPHGRDYRNHAELSVDAAIHRERVLLLSKLHSVIELEALDILDWGK